MIKKLEKKRDELSKGKASKASAGKKRSNLSWERFSKTKNKLRF